MKNDYADVEKIIVEFDNGHETVLWAEDYKFKLKKKKIKFKKTEREGK